MQLFCSYHEKFENIRRALSRGIHWKIRPIFINCVDARRHVTNRFTKCVIAFGFNARPRERHHTRHPANRILLAHSRMNEHKGGERVAASYSAEAAAWYGTLALLFEIHVDNGKTTSVIVINVIDPDLLSPAFTDPSRPSSPVIVNTLHLSTFRRLVHRALSTLYPFHSRIISVLCMPRAMFPSRSRRVNNSALARSRLRLCLSVWKRDSIMIARRCAEQKGKYRFVL